MVLVDLLIAFLTGLLFVLLLRIVFGERTPLGSFWILLLFIFLITWAGGVWIGPFGPTVYDVAWLPFLVVGLFITLILGATVPPTTPQPMTVEQAEIEETTTAAAAGLTFFFWMTLIFALVAILLAYLW